MPETMESFTEPVSAVGPDRRREGPAWIGAWKQSGLVE
jgi:hypothetical protein